VRRPTLTLNPNRERRPDASYIRYTIPNGDRVPCPVGQEDECKVNPNKGTEGLCYGVGHESCSGGGALNPFGIQFLINEYQWTEDLCENDADGDGQTNGEELGDPCCLWVNGAEDVPSGYLMQLAGWEVSHPGFASTTTGQRALCDAYTSSDKGSIRTSFYLEGEDQHSFELRIDNWELRAIETSYVDFVWDIPAEHRERCATQTCYIVGSEALIEQTAYVHHFIINGCRELWSEKGVASGSARNEGYSNGCRDSPNFGWAPGRTPMSMLPDEASNHFSGLTGFSMQVHYDMRTITSGVVDNSGFRVHYSTVPRQHVSGTIVGQKLSFAPSLKIPPNTKRWFLTRQCTISGATDDVNLYAVGFHAHLLGREMYMELWRDGKRSELRDERLWHFDDQVLLDRVKGTVLRNGDVIQSTCVMDSSDRTVDTPFSTGTADEMCWATLQYYPYQLGLDCDGDSWTGTLDPEDRGELIPITHPADCIGASCLHLDELPCDPAEVGAFTSDAAAMMAIEDMCMGGTPLRECEWLVHHIKACAAEDGHPEINPALEMRLDVLVALVDGINRTATFAGKTAASAAGVKATMVILVFVSAAVALFLVVLAIRVFSRVYEESGDVDRRPKSSWHDVETPAAIKQRLVASEAESEEAGGVGAGAASAAPPRCSAAPAQGPDESPSDDPDASAETVLYDDASAATCLEPAAPFSTIADVDKDEDDDADLKLLETHDVVNPARFGPSSPLADEGVHAGKVDCNI